ncbi:MAG TPA: tetratricopeptide repeat protein [Arachidicoccus sp.]
MDRIEKLKEFLLETPKDNFVRHALAMEYLKIGKIDEAQKLLEQLLSDSPDYVGSYYQLGKIFEQKGDTQSAIRQYEEGMLFARKAANNHAYNELQSARDELLY